MDDMYRDYILDHYKNPRNFGELEGATHSYHDSNPLCGDELTMSLRIGNGHVDDVRFQGKGCAISQASASILTEEIKGKTLDEVKAIDRDQVLANLGIPTWGADLSPLDFQDIYYYVLASDKRAQSWEDVPGYVKDTFDKLGIPQAEQKYLAGVGAQYDSEVVYHNIRKDLEKLGVIFMDTDTALKEHADIVKQYFGTVIPANDNKMAALNTAVWSGGSFVYVPKGVKVE